MFYARMSSEPFIDSFISVDESVLLVGSTNYLEYRQSSISYNQNLCAELEIINL